MFFSQQEQEKFLIDKYIIESKNLKENFLELFPHNDLKNQLLFSAYGFFKTDDFAYYLFKINNIIYSFETKINYSHKNFEDSSEYSNFYILSEDILSVDQLRSSDPKNSQGFFFDFKIDLPSEIKYYNYQDEFRILLSKHGEGSIDLYFGFSVFKNKEINFSVKINQALFQVIKQEQMRKMLDERLEMLKKKKTA